MEKQRLKDYFRDWIKHNAINPDMDFEVTCLSVDEIHRSKSTNLNLSYYQCTIESDNSITGKPVFLIYSSLDLLELDEMGDTVSVKPIDYRIIG